MSLTSRAVLGIATTAALLLTQAACTGSPGSSSPAATGSTSITVGNGPFLSNADLYLSERKGYFGEVRLKTAVTVLTAGSNAVPQLLNNGLQFAAVDVATAIAAVAQHLPIEVVAPNTVGSPGERGFAGVLVSPKSGVTSPAGLAGKTVAVNQLNGTAMILTRAALANAGADWKRVKFTEVDPPSLLPTLVAGRVDGAALGEPGVTAAQSQGMTYLFNPERDTIPGIAAFVYITSAAYARAHRDVVTSFQRALLKGHAYANAHPDEVRTTAKTSTQVPAPLLAKAVLPVFGEKAVQPREIATWIALLEQYGDFDPAKAPTPAAVLGR
ncbi:MAG: NitT/TauT family transport system substrate-binding protein [Cryptosporangiaceae bacterium]|jgi:NitT/TauT family transport system substrate-binding protein|nr:NitT/TauT family transport system substrate-binding protein [Cryptosporangiaceae bacterium]